VSVEAAPAEAAAAAETPAEPQLVEVWRPGGRSDEQRPRQHDRNRDRNRGRHQSKPAEGGAPAVAAEGGEGEKREQHRRPRRHQDFRHKPREGAPAEAAATPVASADGAAPTPDTRGDRGPRRERSDGKGRDRDNDRSKKFGGGGDRKGGDRDRGGRDFGRDKGGRDKRENGPSHRPYASSASPPRERDRPIDPNSPFAKLAALKEQLAGNRKD